MKFKHLEIGDLFRMEGWEEGVYNKKIDPLKNDGWTHQEVTHHLRVRGSWVKDEDEVILVKEA